MNKETISKVTAAMANASFWGTLFSPENVVTTIGGIIAIIVGLISLISSVLDWYDKATSSEGDGGDKVTKAEVEGLVDELKEKGSSYLSKIEEKKSKLNNRKKEDLEDGDKNQ